MSRANDAWGKNRIHVQQKSTANLLDGEEKRYVIKDGALHLRERLCGTTLYRRRCISRATPTSRKVQPGELDMIGTTRSRLRVARLRGPAARSGPETQRQMCATVPNGR